MRIELSATPNWLRITWPEYSATVEVEILRRLQSVPGALGSGRRWYAPASQLWRLTELFDKASYQYDAMCAADAPASPTVATPALQGPQSVEDGKWETWLNGVHNAAKKEALDAVKYPKRRRKGKAKQGELGV